MLHIVLAMSMTLKLTVLMICWLFADVVVSTAVKSFTRNMYVLPILMVIAQ